MLSDEEASAYRRQAEHYADRLDDTFRLVLAGRHEEATGIFDREWGQFDRMHEFVLSGGFDDGRLAYRYFLLGAELRRRRRPAAENCRGAEAALQYARSLGPVPHAILLIELARGRLEMSQLDLALGHSQEAVRILRDQPGSSAETSDLVLSNALAETGAILHEFRRLDESALVLGEALNIAQRLGDPEALQGALVNLGVTLGRMEDYEAALRCHQEALTVSERGGDQMIIQRQRANIAEMLRNLRRTDEARSEAEAALAMTRRLGDRREEGRRLLLLGAIAVDSGDLDAAERLIADARSIAEVIGDTVTVADAMSMLAAAYDRSDRHGAADDLRRAAADLLDNIGRTAEADRLRAESEERRASDAAMDRMLSVAERSSAAVRQAHKGNVQAALGAVQRLVEEVRGFDDPRLLGMSLYSLGRVLTLAQRPGDALAAHGEALEVDHRSPAALDNMRARATVLRDAGNYIEAIIAFDEAVAYCRDTKEDGESFGYVLGALGKLAWHVHAYRSATRAYQEAGEILQRVGSDAAQQVEVDLGHMAADRDLYLATHPGISSVLDEDALYRALNHAATALYAGHASTVTVRLNDGQTITGPPQLMHIGTVPMLIVLHAGRNTFVPVERAASIAYT